MLALAFVNAWALWLLPLAAIPIVIHLLNRRRFQTVRWAAMEFLLAAAKRNRRRMRMEQWLILTLRTLAVLLLVLLVARPEFDGSLLGRARAHHIVCLDDSASMEHRGAASTAFEDAGERIAALATRLSAQRDGDLFSLVVGSQPNRPVLAVTPVNAELPARVRSALAGLEVGDTPFDQATVLEGMSKLFAENDGAERARFWIATDFRRHDWLGADGGPDPIVAEWLDRRDPATEHVTLMVVGPDDSDNLAIVAARCLDRVCTVGLPLTFGFDIENRGLSMSPATTVHVEFDHRSRTSFDVAPLGAGEKTTLEFSHTFHTSGDHGVVARLDGDRFSVDDTRATTVRVRESSRVLIVDGDPGDSPEESETFYLHAALEIRGAISSGIEVRLIGEPELAGIDEQELAGFDMLWLCNVGRPSEQALARIEAFVRAGGGLAWFLGNQIDLTYYNRVAFRGGEGVLPARLLEISGDIDEKLPVHLAAKDDPMFAPNTEQIELMFEKLVSVGRFVTIDEGSSTLHTLLRVQDDDGPPLLAERDVGAGRVFLFTSSADAHWNSMPVWPVFVMTTVSMHRAAAKPQDSGEWDLTPSESARFRVDTGEFRSDVSVRPLADDSEPVRTFTAEAGADGQIARLEIPMRELDGYGLFEIVMTRHDGGTRRHLVSRNCHADEGLL
ncbi:MAG: BatA domain-containing protein, partial [Planctomycetes bacterium]|nr:BatA domain-containing protein [Planctomycetota bacterium]